MDRPRAAAVVGSKSRASVLTEDAPKRFLRLIAYLRANHGSKAQWKTLVIQLKGLSKFHFLPKTWQNQLLSRTPAGKKC